MTPYPDEALSQTCNGKFKALYKEKPKANATTMTKQHIVTPKYRYRRFIIIKRYEPDNGFDLTFTWT